MTRRCGFGAVIRGCGFGAVTRGCGFGAVIRGCGFEDETSFKFQLQILWPRPHKPAEVSFPQCAGVGVAYPTR